MRFAGSAQLFSGSFESLGDLIYFSYEIMELEQSLKTRGSWYLFHLSG